MGDTEVSLRTLLGGWGGIPGNSKFKVPIPGQIFIFGGGGIPGRPRNGIIGKMNQKFWKPNLLLHHRLRVWRLINGGESGICKRGTPTKKGVGGERRQPIIWLNYIYQLYQFLRYLKESFSLLSKSYMNT